MEVKPTVINIHKAPKDWRSDPQFVYIGRAGHGLNGYFGNPVKKGETCAFCGLFHEKPGDTLLCYSLITHRRVDEDQEFRRRVLGLRGKTLVCFCKPGPCHGDELAEICEALWEDETEVMIDHAATSTHGTETRTAAPEES